MRRHPLSPPSVLLVIGASVALGACHDWSGYDPNIDGRGGGGAGSSSASSGSGSGSGGGTCTLKLADTFDTGINKLDWTQKVYGDASLSVVNGELVSKLSSPVSGISAYVFSAQSYPLTGCRSFVRLTNLPDVKTNAIALFELLLDDSNAIILLESHNMLTAKILFKGNETPLKSVDYDAVKTAYLGMSELGGNVFWETSSDAKTWNVIHQEPSPWSSSSKVYVKLGSSTYGTVTSVPGEAHFDDLDTAP